MAEKHPKRPRDLNQWAKRMVDLATMDDDELRAAKERQAQGGERTEKPGQSPGKRGSRGGK